MPLGGGSLEGIVSALLLQAGYNAALVAIGAALLGMAAGGAGTFLFLRKRSLVSDAAAHATLPGLALAFMAMAALGGDGRNILGLIFGSAASAALGLYLVDWIGRATRLPQDAAIGAVLSVFFGFGIVLLTVIQTMGSGRQAGLESYLLGSTAGMLFSEAATIAVAGAVAGGLLFVLRRPLTLVAFDPVFAETTGVDVRLTDLAMLALVVLVTVIGLKVVGLVLIVALIVIPSVAARFWTERVDRMALIAAAIGGLAGYVGASISAALPQMPTGAIIVLVAFGLFVVSLLFAPARGLVASAMAQHRFGQRVRMRGGLMALALGRPVEDPSIRALLRVAGYIGDDERPTQAGLEAGRRLLVEEARWEKARELHSGRQGYGGLTPIGDVLTGDEIADIDRMLAAEARAAP